MFTMQWWWIALLTAFVIYLRSARAALKFRLTVLLVKTEIQQQTDHNNKIKLLSGKINKSLFSIKVFYFNVRILTYINIKFWNFSKEKFKGLFRSITTKGKGRKPQICTGYDFLVLIYLDHLQCGVIRSSSAWLFFS